MPLSSRLAGGISDLQRLRGLEYFNQKRARVAVADGERAAYLVLGTEEYAVRLAIEGGVVFSTCTCPYFVKNEEPCKHIWAAILDAERSGALRAGAGVLELEADPLGTAWQRVGENDDAGEDDRGASPASRKKPRGAAAPQPVRPSSWRAFMRDLEAPQGAASPPAALDVAQTEIRYVIYLDAARVDGNVAIALKRRDRRKDGTWGAEKSLSLRFQDAERLIDEGDRRVFALLRGSDSRDWGYGTSRGYESVGNPAILSSATVPFMLPVLAATGRCFVRADRSVPLGARLHCDFDPRWRTVIEVAKDRASGEWHLSGSMARGDVKLPITDVGLVLSSGYFFHEGVAYRMESTEAFPVVALLRAHRRVVAPAADGPRLVAEAQELIRGAEIVVPDVLRFEDVVLPPAPIVRIRRSRWERFGGSLEALVSFRYGTIEVESGDPRPKVFDESQQAFIVRDPGAERAARESLPELGFRMRAREGEDRGWELPAPLLPKVVAPLTTAGWRVEAEGIAYRTLSSSGLRISSGQDWFELRGGASDDGAEVPLPELLKAMQKGDPFVRLGDGALGLLPEEWVARFAAVAGLGEAAGNAVRFSPHQAGLLDALVASLPDVATDAMFEAARTRLASFDGIAPLTEPRSFRGELRGYQRDGLGWFKFLREFGFGGCLADDMGLGKTVQVLALLASRRSESAEGRRPSIVVAPRSVVLNWLSEAARFAPELRILDYTGISRREESLLAGGDDLVVTTYGTLRRDALALSKIEFDYVILDESQAVKNASSQAAKAVRLLQGRHRLALTGTPIENHLGELWTLFEFLNPGMLGKSPAFRAWTAGTKDADDPGHGTLARAVRPFILRRTKEKVAPELPARTEQTLWCDLGDVQRRHYDELRDHYRASLLGRVRRDGLGKSKIHVLEALLRLRQAACHLGLIDRARAGFESAKFELLVERLDEVLDEGHKVLVFSQFTSLLALLRPRLQAIDYAYLDGATPPDERAEAVTRFQTDASCRLFLLSLKAGGLGLNLTAAGYVFLLDPWWNPAVEAQAIDRAHRIGQTKPVMAYRLVARDTVEERILALQSTKRRLADEILAGDDSFLKTLMPEDLEALLG